MRLFARHTARRALFLWLPLAATAAASHARAQCTCTFAPPTEVIFGTAPSFIATADFNSDGRPDVAVSDPSANALFVFFGNGPGTFTPPGGGITGVPAAGPLVTGDFNLDGRTDIAVATSAGVAVFYRTSIGWVNPPTTFASDIPTIKALAVGDINADGRLDLACAGSTGFSVMYGAAGGFQAPVVTTVEPNFTPCDGIAIYPGGSLFVTHNYLLLYGTGSPNGLPYSVPPGGLISPIVADFNVDGRPDVVAASPARNPDLLLLTRLASGGFTQTNLDAAPARLLVAADMNFDGKPDLVANGANVLPGLGNGTFGPPASTGGSTVDAFTVADVNLDGKPDVMMVQSNSRKLITLLNTTLRQTLISQPPVRTFASAGRPTSLSVAVSGDSLAFQWRKDSAVITAASGYTGFNSSTLTIPSAALADSGSVFECVISNACQTITTPPVSLVVTNPCGSPDFNGDGDIGTDADIEAFFRVLSGGHC
jgi:hypothetical protein